MDVDLMKSEARRGADLLEVSGNAAEAQSIRNLLDVYDSLVAAQHASTVAINNALMVINRLNTKMERLRTLAAELKEAIE